MFILYSIQIFQIFFMILMNFIALFSAVATMAAASPVDLSRKNAPLDLKLEIVRNTIVMVSLTNNRSSILKFVNTGSLFDKTPIQKVEVFAAGMYHNFLDLRKTHGLLLNSSKYQERGSNFKASALVLPPHPYLRKHLLPSNQGIPWRLK